MTFASTETSVSDARPIELLEIKYGGLTYRYTSAPEAITWNSNTFEPTVMRRDNLRPTGDTSKAAMTIFVPQDCPVGELFRVQPPSGIVSVTLYQKHYGFSDTEYAVIWKGRIVLASWEPPMLKLITESIISSMQRVGLRRKYSAQCPYALYGTSCTIDRMSQRRVLTVTSLNGLIVNCSGASSEPTNMFAGGYMEWTNALRNTVERRMIRNSGVSLPGDIVLSARPLGLSVSQVIYVFPGCAHTLDECHNKFNNALNFGGMPFIPLKNPFAGSTIY